MFLLKKRVFPILLCLLLLITVFALPIAAIPAPLPAGDAAAAGLAYFKSAFETGYGEGTYKADVWTQLIRRSAGKLADADFAFLSPQVNADALLTLPVVSSGETPKLDANEIAKGIITLLAQGKTPDDQNVAKLVKALAGLQDADGAFGDTAASTAMALVALRCAGYGDFNLDKAVSSLAAKKFSGGGYNDFDFMNTGSGAPESTAFAILGFAAAGTTAAKTEIASAIAFLKTVWQNDGFFLSPADFEANTCIQATVLFAFLTAGEDVTSDAWKKNGVSITDTILYLQDRGSYNGGFWYNAGARDGENEYISDPDQFTNYQALLALYSQLGGSPLTALFRDFKTTPAPVSSTPAPESSRPAPKPNPPTGDRFNPIVWVVLIAAVIAVIVVVLLPVIRKKK